MKKLILPVFLLCFGFIASAQESKTSFFLDHNVYSYRINPAAEFDEKPYTFFALGLGNTSASLLSNLGASSLLYPTVDGLVWGLDDAISTDTFLSKFAKDNIILPQASVNILSFGHQGEKGRFNVEVNLKSDNYFYAAKDVFAAAKDGLYTGLKTKIGTWAFQNMNVSTSSFVEVAAGYAHKIGDMVTVGGTAKMLLGVAGGAFDFNSFHLTSSDGDNFYGSADAKLLLASTLFKIGTQNVGGKNLYDFSSFQFNKVGLAGVGFGLDLGVTVEPVEGLTLGLSALDLGFIKWNSAVNGKIEYSNKKIDVVEDALELQVAEPSNETRMLNYNIHLSAKYRMPFYDRLSVGLLGTYQKYFKEARLGVDITPVRPISIAISGAYNNFGFDFGAALNVRIPGINLFLALDSIYFDMTPQFLPVSRGITNATVGLAIAF
ncbi:MAG: hypothetical protein IJP39_05480 [Bacteroidales bacterium]|nr:hypothetical protein [Bacteroidales bacterium]